MSLPDLLNKHNAIESATFVIGFANSFTPVEIELAAKLKSKLAKKLPNFRFITDLNLEVDSQDKIDTKSIRAGVLFRKFNEDGKMDLALQISKNDIRITFRNYTRWSKVLPTAIDLFCKSALDVKNKDNIPSFFALQIVDKFIEDTENYALNNIFNAKTEFLTGNVKAGRKIWHINQGWIDGSTVDSNAGILNVLNIKTVLEENKIITKIDHLMKLAFSFDEIKKVSKKSLIRINKKDLSGILNAIFLRLHDKNKTLLNDLLEENLLKVLDDRKLKGN